jgi:nucleotide-binding universal stress UspA family protein
MRVLCCLDGTNAEQIAKATEMLSASQQLTLSILYVIDIGPRTEMDHRRERFFRSRARHLPHEEEILESQKASAKDILNAGLRYLAHAETIEREGRPGHEIVNVAAEWQADVVLICARAQYGRKAIVGPKISGTCGTICSRSRTLSRLARKTADTRTISY